MSAAEKPTPRVVRTVAQARRARVELRDQAAAMMGVTRERLRFPSYGIEMRNARGQLVARYAGDQDERIRLFADHPSADEGPWMLALTADVLAGIDAYREAVAR
jgi:hypothetical protein